MPSDGAGEHVSQTAKTFRGGLPMHLLANP
jgi:hypothetical protein